MVLWSLQVTFMTFMSDSWPRPSRSLKSWCSGKVRVRSLWICFSKGDTSLRKERERKRERERLKEREVSGLKSDTMYRKIRSQSTQLARVQEYWFDLSRQPYSTTNIECNMLIFHNSCWDSKLSTRLLRHQIVYQSQTSHLQLSVKDTWPSAHDS